MSLLGVVGTFYASLRVVRVVFYALELKACNGMCCVCALLLLVLLGESVTP